MFNLCERIIPCTSQLRNSSNKKRLPVLLPRVNGEQNIMNVYSL
jgi:hypothetical protein